MNPLANVVILSFQERLREERKKLKLTQEAFALLGGVNKTSQSFYETGKIWPTAEYLEKLRLNGVDIGYLFSGRRESVPDWQMLKNAYLFVQQSFASRQDRNYSADELFTVFKHIVEASMGADERVHANEILVQ